LRFEWELEGLVWDCKRIDWTGMEKHDIPFPHTTSSKQ
jgi:hypothetical protein